MRRTLLIVVVSALVTAGTAAAGTGHRAFDARVATTAKAAHVGGGGIYQAVTGYLQIDTKTLVSELRAGKTLGQIATAHGKTAAGLVDAIVAAAKPRPQYEAKLRAALNVLVNKSFGGLKTSVPTIPPVASLFLKPLTDYLQIDVATLAQELHSGKSLAQIATAHGKTADGVTAAIVAPVKTKLDAAVASGKLSATQRDALVSKLQTSISALVTPQG